MNYRIGLDIGIASVGWAVIETDSKDEPKRIVDLGVRIFDKAEVPKTGASLAAPRREARSARRRIRRRRHRLERIRQLLEREGLITIKDFNERRYQKNLPNVYQLRSEALDRLLSQEELAQVLIHIAKHRGFKSNRKAELKDKENGKVLTAIRENEALIEEKQYRTIGEMIYKDEHFYTKMYGSSNAMQLSPRNKQDDYKHTIPRSLLEEEVRTIFEHQRNLGNSFATITLQEQFLTIMLSQRSFDEGPGKQPDGTPSPYAGNLIENMVGYCTFEPEEKRASKFTFTSELVTLLEKLNHFSIDDACGNRRFLDPDERKTILELAYSKKSISYSDIRKKIHLNEDNYFKDLTYNKDKDFSAEKTKFIELKFWHSIKGIFNLTSPNEITEEQKTMLDKIGTILTYYKSDDVRAEHLEEFQLTQAQIDALLEFTPTKFHNLSLKAMNKILPYLKEGFRYHEACEKAGYNFKADYSGEKDIIIKGPYVQKLLKDIPNPVVKRSIAQTIKVLNAIIRAYGSPIAVHIELAREMSKNFAERKQIQDEMKKNEDRNQKIKQQLQEYGILSPTGQDIVKFKLWQEQGGCCLYTGNNIPIEDLFKNDLYEVDHVLPYSRSFDDSYRNKVLVEAGSNRAKGNRTPYEFFGDQPDLWNMYQQLVTTHIHDWRKQRNLLKMNFDEEDAQAFRERNLTDTRYTTTAVMNLIRQHLQFAPYCDADKKQHVFAVNGSITSYLRRRWGLSKSRATDTHHAQDAVVIACCTNGMIQKISRNIKGRELIYTFNLDIVDTETREIYKRNDFTREQWDEKFGVQIPLPWPWFRKELEMRMSEHPELYLSELYKLGYNISPDYLRVRANKDPLAKELGYWTDTICPIFVSRMPNHKVTGAAHAETIRSARHYKDEHIVVSKTPLDKLKLKNDEIISGNAKYYNPQDDTLLYNALKERLLQYDGNGTKAFAEPFYKPKSDGTPGPLVKKVKMYQKQGAGVFVNNGTGIAENGNGSMVRVDVFQENGKYYFVPIYTSDVVKKELPNKAVVALKDASQWKEMKEENFLFSLYSRDLVYIEHKKGIPMKTTSDSETITCPKILCYFKAANIATASFSGINHNNALFFKELGIQSLISLKKYQVDILGNIHEVKSEKRMRFH